MKQNAKEYLVGFANTQDDWLKALIFEVVESNGNVTKEKLKDISDCLTGVKSIDMQTPEINAEDSDESIQLISLEHIKGVNALKSNQKIKFQKDVTILNGLNGAGKSSYFKTLNEVVGGNEKKEILPNIYQEQPDAISVKIKYHEKSSRKDHEVHWNGTSRSLEHLNKCKVFDTSYLDGLLKPRKADSTLIQPLGLYLFSYLIDLMDQIATNLSGEADQQKLKKPTLELEFLNQGIKDALNNHSISNEEKKAIEKQFDFSAGKKDELKRLEKELKELNQSNIQDKIKLKQASQSAITNLKNHLVNSYNSLMEINLRAEKSYKAHIECEKKSKVARQQFEVLSSIPGNDTSEWKEFIKAGDEYNSILVEKDSDVCNYCRQPLLDENAKSLLNAYGQFLNDESESELTKAKTILDNIHKEVEDLEIEFKVDYLKQALQDEMSDSEFDELLNGIKLSLGNYSLERSSLISALKEGAFEKLEIKPVSGSTIDSLNSLYTSINEQIQVMTGEEAKKAETIRELGKSIQFLKENESISVQKEVFGKWFELDEKEKSLRVYSKSIQTRKLSTLSSQAHNELLTETLKQKFSEELIHLGYPNLDVQIIKSGGGKGVITTKLVLTKNNDVTAILSEGEQKAVALSLFLAEVLSQSSSNPIILDDPVNSLDHNIAANFANRLLVIDNQVILFNHNKLFLDSFESSKKSHICKNFDGGCNTKGRHTQIYTVQSEGKNSKGVLIDFKSNTAKQHIIEAKSLLNNSPFDDSIKVAGLIRKSVECTIDEVIFNKQSPTKFSNKNSRVHWPKLKALNNEPDTIDLLERIHGRASGGEMHNGTENEENPIEVEEFETMISGVKSILVDAGIMKLEVVA